MLYLILSLKEGQFKFLLECLTEHSLCLKEWRLDVLSSLRGLGQGWGHPLVCQIPVLQSIALARSEWQRRLGEHRWGPATPAALTGLSRQIYRAEGEHEPSLCCLPTLRGPGAGSCLSCPAPTPQLTLVQLAGPLFWYAGLQPHKAPSSAHLSGYSCPALPDSRASGCSTPSHSPRLP